MPIPLGILAVAGAGASGPTDFQLIQTVSLTTDTSSVSFTSIPQTFRHLQLRIVAKNNTNNNTSLIMRMNNSSSTVYNGHYLVGDGNSAFSSGYNFAYVDLGIYTRMILAQTQDTNIFNAGIMDILDYANSSKNTTIKMFHGAAGSSGGGASIVLASGIYGQTTPVSSIQLFPDSNSFATGSRFSLFGIKG